MAVWLSNCCRWRMCLIDASHGESVSLKVKLNLLPVPRFPRHSAAQRVQEVLRGIWHSASGISSYNDTFHDSNHFAVIFSSFI